VLGSNSENLLDVADLTSDIAFCQPLHGAGFLLVRVIRVTGVPVIENRLYSVLLPAEKLGVTAYYVKDQTGTGPAADVRDSASESRADLSLGHRSVHNKEPREAVFEEEL